MAEFLSRHHIALRLFRFGKSESTSSQVSKAELSAPELKGLNPIPKCGQ